jgi:hypothetical protein
MRRRRYQDASSRVAVSRGGIGNELKNAPRLADNSWSDPTGVNSRSESLRYRDAGGVRWATVSRPDCARICHTSPPRHAAPVIIMSCIYLRAYGHEAPKSRSKHRKSVDTVCAPSSLIATGAYTPRFDASASYPISWSVRLSPDPPLPRPQ